MTYIKWPLLKVKEYKVVQHKTLFLCCSKSSPSSYSFPSLAQGKVCLVTHTVKFSVVVCLAYLAGITLREKSCLFIAHLLTTFTWL